MIKLGLIGNPVSHSRSPEYFNNLFKVENIRAIYQTYKLDNINQFQQLLNNEIELVGLNVTSPFKREVMRYVDILTPEAERVGAINTLYIRRDEDGKPLEITGHNTDVEGVKFMLRSFADLQLRNALILGSGGASGSVAVALESLGIGYDIITRNDTNVEKKLINYNDIDRSILRENSIIIDATPLGMGAHKEECPPLQMHLIGLKNICIDLVYSPAVTPFLKSCMERGAVVRNGYAMLLAQADAARRFWQQYIPSLASSHE